MGLIGKQVITSSLPDWCWRRAQLVSRSHYYVIMLGDVGTHMGLIGKQNLLQLRHYMCYVIRNFSPTASLCTSPKGTPTGRNRKSAFATTPSKMPGTTMATTNTSKPAKSNTGSQFRTNGKLTEVEHEWQCVKGLCYYCALSIDVAAPDCRNPRHPKPPIVGRAVFAITGEPDATFEEVVEEPPMNSGN